MPKPQKPVEKEVQATPRWLERLTPPGSGCSIVIGEGVLPKKT